jgi:ABC-type glycerol-3-phosphate transport system permease component
MRKRAFKVRRHMKNVPLHIILIIAAVVFIYPTFWVFMASLKTGQELYQAPWNLPKSPTVLNFAKAWERAHLGRAFINSGIVTTASVAVILIVSIFAAFPISHMNFKGRRLIYFVILLGIMVPVEGLIIPLFITLKKFHFLNTYFGVIFPYSAVGVPFTLFVLVNFFKDIPHELKDAALIDGASSFQLLWKIIVPLSVPAIVGVGIFQGSLVWNELIVSLTVLQNEKLYTVPLTLATFLRRFVREWSLTFSTLSLSMIPIVVVYIIFNRQFVRGMTVGAVKG